MTETILARPLHGDEAAMRRALSKDARTSRAAIMPEPHAAPATVRIGSSVRQSADSLAG
jgi:hypothetical protein